MHRQPRPLGPRPDGLGLDEEHKGPDDEGESGGGHLINAEYLWTSGWLMAAWNRLHMNETGTRCFIKERSRCMRERNREGTRRCWNGDVIERRGSGEINRAIKALGACSREKTKRKKSKIKNKKL